MAEYWKSQPKKFCTYCKCWIADNKPSVEFHERGKNHKENVANKITEIKEKSMEKAKQEARATKEFAAMEEAALKAYEEDLKRLGADSALVTTTAPVAAPAPVVAPVKAQSVVQEPKIKKNVIHYRVEKRKPPVSTIEQAPTEEWVEAVSSEGHPYYYNAATGESKWEKPGTIPVWVEAITSHGETYYYNSVTRECRWEKPEESAAAEGQPPPPGTTPSEDWVSEECAVAASTESDSEDEGSSEQVDISEKPEEDQETSEPVVEVSEKPEGDQESSEPVVEVSEKPEGDKEGEEHSETSEDKDTSTKDTEVKQELETGVEAVEEQPAPVQTRAPRRPTAYGTWEEIKEEEDPYEKVDLELPTVEYDSVPGLDVPQEPTMKFKERTITSLGDAAAVGNPVFKKRKTENGKSRNIRQRLNDS